MTRIYIVGFLISFLLMHKIYGQEETLVITQESGSTYVYQNKELRKGLTMNIFRKSANGEFQKINKAAIEMIKDGYALRDALGKSDYEVLAENLGTKSPMSTYLTLVNDRELQALLSFTNQRLAQSLGYLYVDEKTELQKDYTYKIVYRNEEDSLKSEIVEIKHFTAPYIPKAPTDIGLSTGDKQVEINWVIPKNTENRLISGVNVYAETPSGGIISINENLILNTNSLDNAYLFSLPFDNTTYKFFMRSVDMTGQESERSKIVKMTLKDQEAPAAIAGLVARSTKGNPTLLTWRVSLEDDLKGYNVYRAARTIDTFVKINKNLLSPVENFYKDKTVEPGRKYAYVVTAVDASGNESDKTSRVTVFIEDYEAPDAPHDLIARYNEEAGSVKLSWGYGFSQQDFRTFQLSRQVVRNNQQSSFETVNPKVLRETEYFDLGPTNEGFLPGYIYKYHVIAIDSSSNASDTASVIFQIPDLDPPTPPEIKTRNEDGIRVNVSWTASVDYDVVAYKVYRNLNGNDSLLAQNHYSQRLYRDESVQVGNTYIYTVTAIDSLGNEGIKSVADTVFMKDFAPPAPTRNVFAVGDADGVRLKWEQVPDKDLVGYLVYKSDISTGVYKPITKSPITEEKFMDDKGKAGDWYKVKAVDSSGNEAYIKRGVQAVSAKKR